MLDTIELLKTVYTHDDIGNNIEEQVVTKTYCELSNITQNEYYKAKENSLAIKYCVIINTFDYSGQTKARYKDYEYTITRVYNRANDKTEVYLSE